MSPRYLASKPLIGALFKGMDQRTASALADYLSSKGGDITTVLNDIAQRGPRGPRPTPAAPPIIQPPLGGGSLNDVLSPEWDPIWTHRASARERAR